jgi:hypothetical protein
MCFLADEISHGRARARPAAVLLGSPCSALPMACSIRRERSRLCLLVLRLGQSLCTPELVDEDLSRGCRRSAAGPTEAAPSAAQENAPPLFRQAAFTERLGLEVAEWRAAPLMIMRGVADHKAGGLEAA